MEKVRLIPFEYNTGENNMSIDEAILNKAIETNSKQPVFRLYGWRPACISLGRNQKKDFLDEDFLKNKNIDVVSRLTGGRALLHDSEITYSFVCPQSYLVNGESVIASYKEISAILIQAFEKLGVKLTLGGDSVHTKFDYCMLVSTGADLNFNGKKFIGSAQCRKKGYILQHGSIPYSLDKGLLESIFNEQVEAACVTSVKEIFPNLTIEQFCKEFQSAIEEVFSAQVG